MELMTVLIWTLRILLPIILFVVFFKLQPPKSEAGAGPTGHVHSRDQLLAHRRSPNVKGKPAPKEIQTIALKDQTEAPHLFIGPPGGGRARPPGGGSRREPAGPGPPRERRRRDGDERGERGERSGREGRESREGRRRRPSGEEEKPRGPAPEEIVEEAAAPNGEKKELESLLNYVAFNRKEQPRTFLADEQPPPPPPKSQRPKPVGGDSAASAKAVVQTLTAPAPDSNKAEKANADAQLVLKGVIGASSSGISFKRGDVAGDLFKQLTEAQVEVSAQTFTLMIEACARVQDLKGASDFLMRMETAGFTPEAELLDKVMDLYTAQRAQKGQQAEHQAAMQGIELQRAKLSKQAAVFVPSFVPPPPPEPRPTLAGAGDKSSSGGGKTTTKSSSGDDKGTKTGGTKLNDNAPIFVPSASADQGASQRTKLTSSAKAFTPQPFVPGQFYQSEW